MKRGVFACLFIVMVAVEPQQWDISWTPHPDNKTIEIVYQCEGGMAFFAFNTFEITPAQARGTFRRLEPPEASSSCWAAARVVRGGDDPTQDDRGEYTITRMK